MMNAPVERQQELEAVVRRAIHIIWSYDSIMTVPILALARNREIDPNRHQGYINEWILGYRRQLPGQVRLDASFIRRNYKGHTGFHQIDAQTSAANFLLNSPGGWA